MKIKNWRILVMVGWILFFAHAMVWSFVLMFTSNSVYRGDNHSLGPIFSYLTDHETFVKVNVSVAALLSAATATVVFFGKSSSINRWSKTEFALAKTIIVVAASAFMAYLSLFVCVHDINLRDEHPSIGSRVYEIQDIDSNKFVALFDSIRDSKWEYTHYYNREGVVIRICSNQDSKGIENSVEWFGRFHYCNIQIPKGKTEVMMLVYRSTNTSPLEISIYGVEHRLTADDIAEFESLTIDKICTYDRCEKRRHKESYYAYMTREDILLFVGFIGFSIIASLIVLLNLKATRDKYLPPPFNP